MQPEERFAKIEAILQAMAEHMVQAERRMDRADRRMEKFDQRMDRAEQRMDRAEERVDRAERRMEKFDQRLEVTRKLVQVGMKLVIQNNVQLRELQRAKGVFRDSRRKGGSNEHKRCRLPPLSLQNCIAGARHNGARSYVSQADWRNYERVRAAGNHAAARWMPWECR